MQTWISRSWNWEYRCRKFGLYNYGACCRSRWQAKQPQFLVDAYIEIPDSRLWHYSVKSKHSPGASDLGKAAGQSCTELLAKYCSAQDCDSCEDEYDDESMSDDEDLDYMDYIDDVWQFFDDLDASDDEDVYDDDHAPEHVFDVEDMCDDEAAHAGQDELPGILHGSAGYISSQTGGGMTSQALQNWVSRSPPAMPIAPRLRFTFESQPDVFCLKDYAPLSGILEMIACAPVSIALAHYFADLQLIRWWRVPKKQGRFVHWMRKHHKRPNSAPCFALGYQFPQIRPDHRLLLKLTTASTPSQRHIMKICIDSWSVSLDLQQCRPALGCRSGLASFLAASLVSDNRAGAGAKAVSGMGFMVLERVFHCHRRLTNLVKVRAILCADNFWIMCNVDTCIDVYNAHDLCDN